MPTKRRPTTRKPSGVNGGGAAYRHRARDDRNARRAVVCRVHRYRPLAFERIRRGPLTVHPGAMGCRSIRCDDHAQGRRRLLGCGTGDPAYSGCAGERLGGRLACGRKPMRANSSFGSRRAANVERPGGWSAAVAVCCSCPRQVGEGNLLCGCQTPGATGAGVTHGD